MLKYVEAVVTFAEIPDEITLCINISNCPCHCIGCHSPYLAEDIGEVLSLKEIRKLLKKSKGISCICFMGGDACPKWIDFFAHWIKDHFDLKVAWYSGREKLSPDIHPFNFDYIKLGPYKEECGPLNNPTTNQRLYQVVDNQLVDTTRLFWGK